MRLSRRSRLAGVIVAIVLTSLGLTAVWLAESGSAIAQNVLSRPAELAPAPPSPDAPTRPATEGIYDIADLPASMGLFSNVYGRPEGDFNLGAWAGVDASDEEDRSQGILVVGIEDRLAGGTSYVTYSTPTRDGAIKIVSFSGDILSLVAVDGTRFYFDLASRSFVLTSPI